MNNTIEPREILSVEQLATYLDLSQSIIRRLVKNKEIPFVKIKGSYRFYLPTIREWVKANMINPATQSVDDSAHKRAEEIFSSVN